MEAVTPAPEMALSQIVTSPEGVLVEVLDQHGHVQQHERIHLTAERRRFTAGRSASADVTLDDPYAAALHASFEVTGDGRILVDDLSAANELVRFSSK